MSKQNRGKGFTLVELLVVIGIIALLISILLPSLNRAREQANRVKCMNNVKQIGSAMMLYANENKGLYPRARWDGASGTIDATYDTSAGTAARDTFVEKTLQPYFKLAYKAYFEANWSKEECQADAKALAAVAAKDAAAPKVTDFRINEKMSLE